LVIENYLPILGSLTLYKAIPTSSPGKAMILTISPPALDIVKANFIAPIQVELRTANTTLILRVFYFLLNVLVSIWLGV